MSEELVRAFVAIELPAEVKASLGKIQAEMNRRMIASLGAQAADKAIKWVNPEGVHLTLKFLGSVPASRIARIENALRRAAANNSELTIELGGLGAFPSPQRPRVVWIGTHGEIEKLAKIQSEVDSELAALGFPREERAFSPHITLARLRETASSEERRKIGEAVKAGPQVAPMRVHVEAISLMRSELSRAGARYSRIAHIPLRAAK